MIDFSKRIKTGVQTAKIDPIEIYNTLDRASATGPLRPVQANVLTNWHNNYRDNKDLILKLHTGAGKTLIGLLMAMSYLNSNSGPAIYVCPNIYLMQQACADAIKFGIPFCVIKADNELPNEFLQGKSVLVTYVQKVFNGLSIFGTGNRSTSVGCIILDDSHACMDSMLGSCTIKIMRESPAYTQILELVESQLKEQGNGTLQDLLFARTNAMMPIPYWCWQTKIDEITRIISRNSEDKNILFAWPIIKDQLIDCQAYISCSKIEISPICMPIQQYGIFSNAKHRILMSATTQEDTFFIKGLGLSVDAVASPLTDETYRWSGEKMILIPDAICESVSGDMVLRGVISNSHDFGIAVLTPSFEKAKKYVGLGAVLANDPDAEKNMYHTLQEFLKDHKDKSLVFANRYDGIDLPDDTCRVLIIDSVPYYDSLADRYEEQCRAESEIIRIKTVQKIEQGLGRSVRGEKDYSVILIVGSDLIKYLRSVTNQELFSPQTKQQIQIGFNIIEMAKEDLVKKETEGQKETDAEINLLFSTIRQCLERDDGWKMYYSSTMDEVQVVQYDKSNFYNMLKMERQAYDEITVRNYDAAAKIYQDIADMCRDETEKGWYIQEKARMLHHTSHSESNKAQVSAFKKNNQLLKPQSGIVYNKIKYPLDHARNARIVQELCKYGNYDELCVHLEDILSNMSIGMGAEKAEDAFFKIGQLLGYVSQRPDKEIRKGPDVLWCVSEGKYVLIECKTEVLQTRTAINKVEAGQMEEHCAWFKDEYGQESFLPLLVISTEKLSEDAYFSHDVKVLKKENLEELKSRIREFFKEFKGLQFASIELELVNQKLATHHLYDDSYLKTISIAPRR